VRDRDAAYRALRALREGRDYRPRRYVIDGTAPRLPSGPLRAWLVAYRLERGIAEVAALAAELGLVRRRVASLLAGEQESVTLDVVDVALSNAEAVVFLDGRYVLTLDDLYPLGV
jgi:hypothetical protein